LPYETVFVKGIHRKLLLISGKFIYFNKLSAERENIPVINPVKHRINPLLLLCADV